MTTSTFDHHEHTKTLSQTHAHNKRQSEGSLGAAALSKFGGAFPLFAVTGARNRRALLTVRPNLRPNLLRAAKAPIPARPSQINAMVNPEVYQGLVYPVFVSGCAADGTTSKPVLR